MNRLSAEERYRRDPLFSALVRAMESMIEKLEMTPTEIREAAVFAAIRVDQRSAPGPIYVDRPPWVDPSQVRFDRRTGESVPPVYEPKKKR